MADFYAVCTVQMAAGACSDYERMSDHRASSLNVFFNHLLKCICIFTFEKKNLQFSFFWSMYFIMVARFCWLMLMAQLKLMLFKTLHFVFYIKDEDLKCYYNFNVITLWTSG